MVTSNALPADVQAELLRRHKSTVTTILSLLVAVVLLCVLAYVSQKFLTQRANASLDMGVRISILIFGLGAIALRRTRFARMRLQDIAALQLRGDILGVFLEDVAINLERLVEPALLQELRSFIFEFAELVGHADPSNDSSV